MTQSFTDIEIARIASLCERFGVVRLDLTGSAAAGDSDAASSDFDFLVDFGDAPRSGLDDRYFQLLAALEDLFSRRIDLIETHCMHNPIVRASLQRTRLQIYPAPDASLLNRGA